MLSSSCSFNFTTLQQYMKLIDVPAAWKDEELLLQTKVGCQSVETCHHYHSSLNLTSDQSNLTRGHIALFVLKLLWRQMHSSAVCTGQTHSPAVGTMHSCIDASRCVGTCPLKSALSCGKSGPHLIHGSFDPVPKRHLDQISISAQLPMCPTHRQTDRQTMLCATSVAICCT